MHWLLSRTVPKNSNGKAEKRKRRRKDPDQQGLTMYFNNINGYVSKKDSLADIINVHQPDVIGLCETKMGKKEEVAIDGYDAKTNNLKKGQEGLAVAIRKGTYRSMEVISDDEKTSFLFRLYIRT